MTRSEFIDEIEYFGELQEFCNDNDIYLLDDYFDGCELDSEVDDDIRNCDYSWESIRDRLNNIQTGWDFYRRNGYFDYVGCDDEDFNQLKDDVMDIMDNRGSWDYDEDEEDDADTDEVDEEYVYRDPVIEAPNEDMSLEELLGIMSVA